MRLVTQRMKSAVVAFLACYVLAGFIGCDGVGSSAAKPQAGGGPIPDVSGIQDDGEKKTGKTKTRPAPASSAPKK